MAILSAVWHLLNFVAPALALAAALGVALWLQAPARGLQAAWRSASWLAASGVLVLTVGLAWFGHDGKMVTYTALVAVMGTVAWWRARG